MKKRKMISLCTALLMLVQIFGLQPTQAADSDFVIENGVLKSYTGAEETVTVPEGVTEIGDLAFAENATVRQIILPEGVTQIGEKAFQNCAALTQLSLPDSLTRIGYGAISGCESLETLTLPVGIKTLYTNIFSEVVAYQFSTPGPDHPEVAQFGDSYVKELTIMNPNFRLFTDEDPDHFDLGDLMETWPQALVNLQTVYGYLECDAEILARQRESGFVPLEKTYQDAGTYYNNKSQYYGDVNNTQSVTAEDALLILKASVELVTDLPKAQADVNGDGAVDAEDALQTLYYVVKQIPLEVVSPEAFEIRSFDDRMATLPYPLPEPVEDSRTEYVLDNAADAAQFAETVLKPCITKENTVYFSGALLHFASLDEEYFEKNICVVIVEKDDSSIRKYSVYTLEEDRTPPDGESAGSRLLLHVDSQYYLPRQVTCTSVESITIPREALHNGKISRISYYRGYY